jgi:uncharacterized repeat protein (TIGR02543 family)
MKRKRLITTAAGTLVAATIAGVAWASIPGAGNVYTACMLKGVGTIRLIDKSLPSTNLMSRCTDKETEISWNQTGQPGPVGPQGSKGDVGPAGPQGAKGDPGRGLSSLGDLAGVPCHTPDFDGVVEISSTPLSAKTASVVVRCTIPNSAILTVVVADLDQILQAASGRVTGGPVDCEVPQALEQQHTCVYVVPLGTTLTLTATPLSPDERYESIFRGWLTPNDCVSTTTPCTFTVTGDLTVVAQFSAKPVAS